MGGFQLFSQKRKGPFDDIGKGRFALGLDQDVPEPEVDETGSIGRSTKSFVEPMDGESKLPFGVGPFFPQIPSSDKTSTFELGQSEEPGKDTEFVGPKASTELERLQNQQHAMDHPVVSKKNRILQAIATMAPTALAGIFGGPGAAAGAAEGTVEGQGQQLAIGEGRRNKIIEQIEAEKGRQERLQEHQMTVRQQIAAMNQTAREAALNRENQRTVAGIRKAEPRPGVDIPFSPEVFTQQRDLKKAALVAGRDIPLSEEVANQQRDLRKPAPVAGRDIPYPADVEAQRKRMSPQTSLTLTQEGLDIAAEMFAKTGQMPAMGMGGGSARSAIINRAAVLYPKVDLAGNKAAYDANRGSLVQLQKNRDAVVSFENTATKNLDIFLNAAKPILDSGSPLINTPLRAISTKGLGNAEIAAYSAARRVAINEIAKVTSNPNLTGQLTDAARKEVESFIPENATLAQVFAVAKILKQDMANRHLSLDEQIGAIQQRIGGKGAPSSEAQEPVKVQRNRATKQFQYSTDGGKTWQPGKPPSQ